MSASNQIKSSSFLSIITGHKIRTFALWRHGAAKAITFYGDDDLYDIRELFAKNEISSSIAYHCEHQTKFELFMASFTCSWNLN